MPRTTPGQTFLQHASQTFEWALAAAPGPISSILLGLDGAVGVHDAAGVLAALGASACCSGPLILLLLGVRGRSSFRARRPAPCFFWDAVQLPAGLTMLAVLLTPTQN